MGVHMYAGRTMNNLVKAYRRTVTSLIDAVFIPRGFIEARIDKGQIFLLNPSFSAQGYALFLTSKYGSGSELLAQKVFATLVKGCSVVVDVGAHYGFYTVLAAHRVGPRGRVFSFEPSSYNFRVLSLNVWLNGYDNVRLFNCALGDRKEVARLGIPRGARSGDNTIAIGNNAIHVEAINVTRFDSVMKEANVGGIDLVKVDVEGAEFMVLGGFGKFLGTTKFMIIEVHPQRMRALGTYVESLYALLGKSRFRTFLIHGFGKLLELDAKEPPATRHHLLAVRENSLDKLDKVNEGLRRPYDMGLQSLSRGIELRSSTGRFFIGLANLWLLKRPRTLFEDCRERV